MCDQREYSVKILFIFFTSTVRVFSANREELISINGFINSLKEFQTIDQTFLPVR